MQDDEGFKVKLPGQPDYAAWKLHGSDENKLSEKVIGTNLSPDEILKMISIAFAEFLRNGYEDFNDAWIAYGKIEESFTSEQLFDKFILQYKL